MILPKQEKLRVEVSSEYCQESFCFKFVPKSCNKVYKTILVLIKTYNILYCLKQGLLYEKVTLKIQYNTRTSNIFFSKNIFCTHLRSFHETNQNS